MKVGRALSLLLIHTRFETSRGYAGGINFEVCVKRLHTDFRYAGDSTELLNIDTDHLVHEPTYASPVFLTLTKVKIYCLRQQLEVFSIRLSCMAFYVCASLSMQVSG